MKTGWKMAIAASLLLMIAPLPSKAAVASGTIKVGGYGTTCPLTPNCSVFWADNCQDPSGQAKQRNDAVSTSIVDVVSLRNTIHTFAVTRGTTVAGQLPPKAWVEFYGLDPLNPASGNPFTCQTRTFKAGTAFVKFKSVNVGGTVSITVPGNANWLMVTGEWVTDMAWTLT